MVSIAPTPTGIEARPLDVVIIGAGFAGIAMAHRLARDGRLTFLVLEKGDRPGGTWRDNVYPGCACDIPAPLYSLSFAPNRKWSRLFATQTEILDYFDDVVRDFALARHIRLKAEMRGARWIDSQWQVTLTDGSVILARSLVSAMGVLHHADYPEILGRDSFAGKVLHTAHWDQQFDLVGKRVAVIGTGASAIQLVPAIADKVAHLTLFQRTPPWIVPKFDRPFDDATLARLNSSAFARWRLRFQLFLAHERRATAFTKRNQDSIAATLALCKKQLERQIPDPALRARLTPDYELGCKRLLISSNYYPALMRPNVGLVTDRILCVEPDAVVSASGHRHPAEVLIFGTGFDAQHALKHVSIAGRDGRLLAQKWHEEGMSAFLGTTVSGFPNFYLITGPNAGGGHNSQIFMIEAQVHYIVAAINRMHARRARSIEVKPEAERRFAREMAARMGKSVWQNGRCQSWFLDPRTGRNTLLWPSYSTSFWLRTRRLGTGDYRLTWDR